MENVKVAIVGSRGFNHYCLLKQYIDDVCEEKDYKISLVISGGARGADKLGELYAKEKGIETLIFPAEWEKFGKRAGFIRNVDIIENCDICFAFWDGESHGTKHDIEMCKQMKKQCFICRYSKN